MKKYRDETLRTLYRVRGLHSRIDRENVRQLEKWGVQEHTLPEWLMFLTEEVGELAEAIAEFEYRKGAADKIRDEAIEVVTLGLKIAEMITLQEIGE